MLIFPADSSILQSSAIQFTWTPPAPVSLFGRLGYDVVVTEVRPGQQPAEALQENLPFYSTSQITANFESYPVSLPKFENGKWYAWQVIARDERSYAAKTETWVFSVRNDSLKQDPATISYLLLGDANGGLSRITKAGLFVKYYCYDKDHEATLQILQSDGKVIQQLRQPLQYGDNYFRIPIKSQLRTDVVYTLQLIDTQGKVQRALFTINY